MWEKETESERNRYSQNKEIEANLKRERKEERKKLHSSQLESNVTSMHNSKVLALIFAPSLWLIAITILNIFST